MGMKSLNMHYSFGWPAINWQSEVGRVEKSNVFLCSNVWRGRGNEKRLWLQGKASEKLAIHKL